MMISFENNIVDTGEELFRNKEPLQKHLAWHVFQSLYSKSEQIQVVDWSGTRREITAGDLLVRASLLADKIKVTTDKKRVGLIFFPGIEGFVANLAVVLADKSPVNLNFTLGNSSMSQGMSHADIELLVSAAPFKLFLREREFPESDIFLDVAEFFQGVDSAEVVARKELLATKTFEECVTELNVPVIGGDEEAALLYTSGSSGAPKGVVLTHRNIVGNCHQIEECNILPESEVLLGNIPIFHSFGFTVCVWYSLFKGMKVVTVPSPLDINGTLDAIATESVTAMCGTATFYRAYLKKGNPEQLKSLRFVIAGAEKTPVDLVHQWEKNLGSEYLQGYGLTETTPVVSVNLPQHLCEEEENKRIGASGKLFPGMQARIVDPETGELMSPFEEGMLHLKGCNIFGGYLNEPEKTGEVLRDGWLTTGDIARFDKDGFIYIVGRLSRFSKIGGEMVPHGTIEEAIISELNVDQSEGLSLVVTGRPDDLRGESLVVFTKNDISKDQVFSKLKAKGFPNLWIPREIRVIDSIPCLTTGKLDLVALKDL